MRHTDVQTEFVALGKDADAWVRRTNVQELRVLRSSDSQRQGDVAIDNFGPEQLTMLTDFVMRSQLRRSGAGGGAGAARRPPHYSCGHTAATAPANAEGCTPKTL